MKKLHLLFAGAFVAFALVACSDDELETETTTETETETDEENTGDENTDDENTGDEEEAPQAYITLSEAELQFARTGGEATVTVDANYDWDCEYESDWFTVVADTNAGTITVSCDANETGEVREGTVTVTAGDGEENVAEATLTITQLAFDPESLVLEYTINEDGTEIQLPLGEKDYYSNEYSVDCTVDWGDGSEVATVTRCWPSHTYSAGTYTVIINGTVELLCDYDYDTEDDIKGVECLTAVKQWGDLGLKSMDSAFYDCANLASLPEGSGSFSNVTSFYYAFAGCTSLTTVPEDIFSNCISATDFSYAFYDCSSLTTVPDNLFANCPSVESFEGVFGACTSLETVPVRIFNNNKLTTNFSWVFYDCESLTTVPEDIFSGCTAVENFGYAFCYCTALTTIPENLFANCPSVLYFDGVFYWCYSLETVPVGIFDNNKSVTDFGWAFYDCTKLVGESPYTEIDVDGTPVKVHLYERENHSGSFTAPTDYEECFTDCTGLDDYYSIPSGWGGGASPTSITPQSLNATSREERSPSRLSSQRATMRPRRDAATPQERATRPLPTRK